MLESNVFSIEIEEQRKRLLIIFFFLTLIFWDALQIYINDSLQLRNYCFVWLLSYAEFDENAPP